MYILTIDGIEDDGVYSVSNEHGEKVLYLFEEEDDATRFAMMLEEEDYPTMNVLDVDAKLLMHVCDIHDHKYVIITTNDIVIPPKKSDFV